MKAQTIEKRNALVGTFVMAVATAASGQRLSTDQFDDVSTSMRALINGFGYDRDTHGVIISQLDDLAEKRPVLTLSLIESVMSVAAKHDAKALSLVHPKSSNREALNGSLALVWRHIMLDDSMIPEDSRLNRARETAHKMSQSSVRLAHEAHNVADLLRSRMMKPTALRA